MAPRLFPTFGLLRSVVLIAFAVSARVSAATDVPPPAVAVADRRFLRACCANTTNASACYDSLLRCAGSFHGNHVLVARAAAVLAYARLRSFRDELRRLPPGATGAGRVVDMTLQYCATSADVFLYREGDSLAELRRLETAAGRRRGEQARWDLNKANINIGAIGSCATSCIDNLVSTGDAGQNALASPVGKHVVAWVEDVRLYGGIALDLVASIKL